MAILETAIMLKGENLIEKSFYSTQHMLDKNIRRSLLQALTGMATDVFGENIQSFSIGEYSIVVITQPLEESFHDDEEEDEPSPASASTTPAPEPPTQLQMFCIIDKNSDEKTIKNAMHDALFQFKNRYSSIDIKNGKMKDLPKFAKRLDSIFGDLVLKSEDRFKSLF